METHPIKLTHHVRAYAFGERLIPEMLGKKGVPEGAVAETWKMSDYRETTGEVKNGPNVGRTQPGLVAEVSIVACYVPDLERDVVAPLREVRHSDGEIRALGEVTV
jgi:hypothetical protein